MIAKYIIVLAAMVVCEAKIEIPGLEDLPKCSKLEEDCILSNGNKIIKAISKPYEKYGIEGYDPITLSPFDVPRPTYKLTQYFNVTVTGLGDTKIFGGKLEEENGQKIIRETYEHNFKFAGQAKVVFHIDPEVSHEGPISGSFSGLRSTFAFPIKVVEKDGQKYLEIGHETLASVDMPNVPDLNKEEATAFLSHPATENLVQKIKENPLDYHQGLAEKIVIGFQTKFFENKRKFYSNVPLSELKKSE